jgi:hypothetical protein
MDDALVQARRVGRSPWVEPVGRFGLLAKGVSFVIVAVIALKVAVGKGGPLEDRRGALEALADEPFGGVLLGVLAAGFASYATWRLAESLLDRGGEGEDAKGLAKRAAAFGKAVVYGGLAVGVVMILLGSGGSGSKEKKATAWALEWPFGEWIVGAAGLAFVAAGVVNAYRAVTFEFEKDLEKHEMSRTEQAWFRRVGVLGYAARGVVFGLIGAFLIKAAAEYDSKEAIGLDGALAKLAAQTYGTFLLGLTAVGLLCYGLFCFVQARYRDV